MEQNIREGYLFTIGRPGFQARGTVLVACIGTGVPGKPIIGIGTLPIGKQERLSSRSSNVFFCSEVVWECQMLNNNWKEERDSSIMV